MFSVSPKEREAIRWAVVAWLVIAILHYYRGQIGAWLPVLGELAVWGFTLILAAVFGVNVVGRLLWGKHWLQALIACVTMVAAGAIVVWPGSFVLAFYGQNAAGFAVVGKLADEHRLDLEGYYGGRLPLPLTPLSVNGRVARMMPMDGEPRPEWVFLPRWLGLLDGAVGYAYLPQPPPRETAFNGFGDAIYVCRSLGSDWYWVTYRGALC